MARSTVWLFRHWTESFMATNGFSVANYLTSAISIKRGWFLLYLQTTSTGITLYLLAIICSASKFNLNGNQHHCLQYNKAIVVLHRLERLVEPKSHNGVIHNGTRIAQGLCLQWHVDGSHARPHKVENGLLTLDNHSLAPTHPGSLAWAMRVTA